MIVLGMIRQHIAKIIFVSPLPKLSPRGDSCNGEAVFAGVSWVVLNLRRRLFFCTTRKSFSENQGG